MVTDDVLIDRRIIAEGRSLIERGNEVILLAGPSPDTPRFERRYGLKIERSPLLDRLPDRRLPHREFLFRVREAMSRNARADRPDDQPGTAAGIPKASAGGGEGVGGRASFRWLISNGRPGRIAVALAGFPVGYARFILLTIALGLIKASSRVRAAFSLPLQLAARRTELSAWEQWLLERLLFYRPDVIHAHDLPQLRASALAKLASEAPLIYDAHELYPEIGTLAPRDSAALARIEATYVKFADAVITVNRYIAGEFAKRYGIPSPEVIWSAIDPPADLHTAARRRTLRDLTGLGPDARILLFQGWMSPTRGLQDLVLAMPSVRPEVHLVFLGYGDTRDRLASIAADAKVRERVHFLDVVPQDELLYLTASADAGIIPYQAVDLNNKFCSPNKLFEYIQARLPIIANDLPFLRDVVTGEGLGIVERLDEPRDFAVAINAMFDPALGGADRFRGELQRKAGRYAWSVQEKALIEIYRRVAATGAAE